MILLAKIWLAKISLVAALLFGKKRPSAGAADMTTPRPCWLQGCGTPTATAEARPGTAEHGSGVEAHRADTGAALGHHLVNPRRSLGRRRRIRRRPVPH